MFSGGIERQHRAVMGSTNQLTSISQEISGGSKS